MLAAKGVATLTLDYESLKDVAGSTWVDKVGGGGKIALSTIPPMETYARQISRRSEAHSRSSKLPSMLPSQIQLIDDN